MYAKGSKFLVFLLSVFPITAHGSENPGICQQRESVDKDHPEPLTACQIEAPRPEYPAKLKRSNPLPKREDIDYHDTKKVRAGLSRASEEETTASFWYDKAENELQKALEAEDLNTNVAKNSIIFLGDGMGVQTITAARILKGQMNGQSGEEYELEMDKLPHVAFSKTYNVDYQVPDSAGTATAYLTGVKGRYSTIGVNAGTVYNVCSTLKGNEVMSVLKKAKLEGKSTGIVTTTYVIHATPAGAFANTPSRSWYDDGDLPITAKGICKDIAQQLYDSMPLIDVVLGGGRRYFRPDYVEDEYESGSYYYRKDGQDLIEMWLKNTEANGERAAFVGNKEEFDVIDSQEIDHLWGMFARGSMDYEVDRDPAEQPSLAEMTRKAIEILQRNENGFYLLVEGARIDHGHHSSRANKALHDAVAFDDAIGVGKEMTSDDDTMIVVTADHSHTFNMGEYGVRGNPIFGLAPSNDDPELALDAKRYTTLSYGNGPGYQGEDYDPDDKPDYTNIVRQNPTVELAGDKNYRQQSAVPLSSETHGGEDVAILASGPMAHLFHGVHEQNYIAHVMSYAACIGDNKDHCLNRVSVGDAGDDNDDASSDTVEFIGYDLTADETLAALNSLFALEIIFAVVIVALLGTLIKQKKI